MSLRNISIATILSLVLIISIGCRQEPVAAPAPGEVDLAVEAKRLANEVLIIDKGVVIASGTPEALKRNLDRDVLEIHVDEGDMASSLDLIGEIEGLVTDEAEHRIGVPVGDDIAGSLEVLRRLQDGGVSITDFQLRRPTLDDVFLNLTGAPTEQEEVPA